jgi:cytochrome c
MRGLRAGFIVCAGALFTSLVLARVHPFGDPGLSLLSASAPPIMERSSVPPDVRATLAAKCADCHSVQTHAPVYGRFAPVSWLIERDIVAGRQHMNLSLWDSYTAEEQQNLKAKIAQQAKKGEMPPPQYRMIHWKAAINDADVENFAQWARATVVADRSAEATSVGDPVRGKTIFEKRCTGCHSMEQNREGPRLQGVYGRVSGTLPDFRYSTALVKARIVWNDVSLEQWLADPNILVPGNEMDFYVATRQERRDLIRFLKQASSQ